MNICVELTLNSLENVVCVQTMSKKMSGRKNSYEEISVMNSVLHHPYGCNMCRKFDRLKEESKNKVKKKNVVVESEMAFPSMLMCY